MAEFSWGTLPESIELEGLLARARDSWPGIGLVAAWEAQSYLATFTLITLLTLVSFWAALGVMIVWSVVASQVYPLARHRGLPDLLERDSAPEKKTKKCVGAHAAKFGWLCFRVWIMGIQCFLFARIAGACLTARPSTWYQRLGRLCVVGLGLTLFGVSAADHILRKAGLSGRRLSMARMAGPFLNVPYRLVLSAIVINALFSLVHLLSSGFPATQINFS